MSPATGKYFIHICCLVTSNKCTYLVSYAHAHDTIMPDVGQEECLFSWKAHEGNVYNIQFSSDETCVYSMGEDNRFSQWNIMKSGTKMVDFKVHDSACQPAAGWVQGVRGGERQRYYPSVPRGNLFAFESEDKFVLTCSPQLAVVYQVRTCACTCGVIVGLANKTGS